MGLLSRIKSLADGRFTRENVKQNQAKLLAENDILSKADQEIERRKRARRNALPDSKVLIIDDSKTILAILGKMLSQNQYQVLKAVSAEQGLEIAFSEQPELIFLDLVLPSMDGFAALRRLRKDPRSKNIPIIMMSGNQKATEIFYAQRIGADDFMKKPFSRYEVFYRIEKLIDSKDRLRRFSE